MVIVLYLWPCEIELKSFRVGFANDHVVFNLTKWTQALIIDTLALEEQMLNNKSKDRDDNCQVMFSSSKA